MLLDGPCPLVQLLELAAAKRKKMRLELAVPPPVDYPREESDLRAESSASLAILDAPPPAPSTAPGPSAPASRPASEDSADEFFFDESRKSPPPSSSSLLPQPADSASKTQERSAGSAAGPQRSPSRSPTPARSFDDPAKPVRHYRIPAISSRAFEMSPCPPSKELSRGYRDGSPVVVPLAELERDQLDPRPYMSESIVHLDGLGFPRFRTVLGENHLASEDLTSHLKISAEVPLWSCTVGGVEFVLSCSQPVEGDELRLLRRLVASCKVHIAPGARVVQKPGSPACAWSNRDWCIGCGSDWHPLALCPLVVRVVRDMIEKGMEVNFDNGFCMRCGYIGHTSGYCRANLDRTMNRLWQAYCARERRWSCLDVVYPGIELPPLSKALRDEGCSRDLPLPGRRAAPLPLCVRCSRPTGEARELLQEVLERQKGEERKRVEREQLRGDDEFPLSQSSTLTRLPDGLRLPEPAVLAATDPVRLMSCVSTWQNWCAFGSQELSTLGHQLVWQVRRMKSLPFGGFPDLGYQLPRALPLYVPAGVDLDSWRSSDPRSFASKRRSSAVFEVVDDEPANKKPHSRHVERRPSASGPEDSSRSSDGRGTSSSSRLVVESSRPARKVPDRFSRFFAFPRKVP
ncbi:hypothetical protein Emed_007443 [Eimeria media]